MVPNNVTQAMWERSIDTAIVVILSVASLLAA